MATNYCPSCGRMMNHTDPNFCQNCGFRVTTEYYKDNFSNSSPHPDNDHLQEVLEYERRRVNATVWRPQHNTN